MRGPEGGLGDPTDQTLVWKAMKRIVLKSSNERGIL